MFHLIALDPKTDDETAETRDARSTGGEIDVPEVWILALTSATSLVNLRRLL